MIFLLVVTAFYLWQRSECLPSTEYSEIHYYTTLPLYNPPKWLIAVRWLAPAPATLRITQQRSPLLIVTGLCKSLARRCMSSACLLHVFWMVLHTSSPPFKIENGTFEHRPDAARASAHAALPNPVKCRGKGSFPSPSPEPFIKPEQCHPWLCYMYSEYLHGAELVG